MIDRFRDIARALVAVLLLGVAGAAAQTAQSPASPSPGSAVRLPRHKPARLRLLRLLPSRQVRGPQINTAEITARANQSVGVSIQTTIAGWQRELDRLESDLQKPHLRYSELNGLRDELQRVRAGIEDFWNRLEPPLAAVKAQVDLLGRRRPLVNHQSPNMLHSIGPSSIITSGCYPQARLRSTPPICGSTTSSTPSRTFAERTLPATCSSPSLASTRTRLGRGCRTTCPRRRAAFATSWPIGGTVSATGMRSCIVAFEAVLLWLVLTVAAWHGVRRLRRWRHEGEPPFWRRASSAAGVILLRILPVVAPIMFLYGIIADAHASARTRRLDFLLGSAIDHHHFRGQCTCHHGVRTEGISVAVDPRFRSCSCTHLRPRPGACDCLRRVRR